LTQCKTGTRSKAKGINDDEVEMMKLPSLDYCTKNHELKPISRVRMEEVSPECPWWEIYGRKDLPKR